MCVKEAALLRMKDVGLDEAHVQTGCSPANSGVCLYAHHTTRVLRVCRFLGLAEQTEF